MELRRGAEVLLAHRRKELCLLTYLARQRPRSIERAVAAALLWGDRDDRKSRVSLRQAIFELRSVLEEQVEADGSTVGLQPTGLTVDVDQFEEHVAGGRYFEAVRLWGGPFLPGGDEFGDERWRTWLDGERAGLQAQLGIALTGLALEAERRADWQSVIDWSNRQLESHPYDEGAGARLVRALHQAGRGTEATAAAARFRDRLRRDLDAEPGPDFHIAAVASPGAGPKGHPGARGLVTPDLVGREAQLAVIAEAWATVVRGAGGRTVIITGESGIGKSRLVTESGHALVRQTERTAVVSSRVFESERGQPWSAVRPLIDRLADAARGMVAAPPEVLAAAARVIPELAKRFGQSSSIETATDPGAAIVRLISEAAAEQPVALLIDDAPDADAESAAVLSALIRRPPSGLLLVMAGRPLAWKALPISADLARERPDVHRVDLGPLDGAESRALVESMAPFAGDAASQIAAATVMETGGVPALTIAAVQYLADSGQIRPGAAGRWELSGSLAMRGIVGLPALRDQIRTTLLGLSAEAGRILELASVIGPLIDSALLEQVGGLPPEGYQRAIGELLAGRHLREVRARPAMLEFPSEAVRQGIYQDLAPSVRRRHHAAVAVALRPAKNRVGWLAAALTVIALGVTGVVWTALRPASPLEPGTGVLLAEPINHTSDSLVGAAIGSAARIALQETGHIWVAPANQIEDALKRMGRPGGSKIVGELAREVALRENLPVVVELSLAQTGPTLILTGRLIESSTGRDLAAYSARTRSADDLTERVAGLTARMLADFGSTVRPVDSLPRVTTSSLAALGNFALGEQAWDRREWQAAARYWRRAIEIDSTFAMAHASLGLFEVYPGNHRPEALAHYDVAKRFSDRLTERERLVINARRADLLGFVHVFRDLSAALAERFPTPVTVENYGQALYRAGRCPEAIPTFRRAIAMRATSASPWLRLATCLQLVDSASAAVSAYLVAGGIDSTILYTDNVNQEFGRALVLAGRPAAAESVFRIMTQRPGLQSQGRGLRSLAYLAISRRRFREAVTLLDEATARNRVATVLPLPTFRNEILAAQSLGALGNVGAAQTRLAGAERLMAGRSLEAAFSHYAGRAFLAAGNLPAARRWLARVETDLIRTNHVDSSHYRLFQAAMARAAGEPRRALDLLGPEPPAQAIQNLGPYWGERGRAYLALGKPDSALAAFRRADRFFTWGFELQYEWEQLPLLVAEAALGVNDTALARRTLGPVVEAWRGADSSATDVRRARELLDRLDRKAPTNLKRRDGSSGGRVGRRPD